MQKIVTYLTLDYNDSESYKVVNVKQGDDYGGRRLIITLTDNGEEVDLSGNDNTAKFFASINGTITAAGDTVNIVDNKVVVPIMDNLTSIAGIEHCEVRISSDAGIVYSARFDLNVGESAVQMGMPALISAVTIAQMVDNYEEISDSVENIQTDLDTFPRELIKSVFPDFNEALITVNVSETASLQGNNPYYDFNTFTPDGLIACVYRDSKEKCLLHTTYTPTSGTTRIYFNTAFLNTDVLRLYFYIKPYVSSSAVKTIWTGTQAQYDAITTPDSNTLYIIEGASS